MVENHIQGLIILIINDLLIIVLFRDKGRIFYGKASLDPTGEATNRETIIRMLGDIKNSVGDLSMYIQNVYVKYLEQRCQTFVAGQVAGHFQTWVGLTSDNRILSEIVGMGFNVMTYHVSIKFSNL